MNDNSQGMNWFSFRRFGVLALIITIILVIAISWSYFGRNSTQALMPVLPTPTALTLTIPKEPEAVSFSELNEDPLSYVNRALIVTGDYLPLDASNCKRTSGPDINWALTAENLQLNVLGFEQIVDIVPEGTTMTVEGIWKLYQGHLGCGKAPPQGSIWYLDIKKIVNPNPLVGKGGQHVSVEIITTNPELPSLAPAEPPSSLTLVPTQTALPTPLSGTIIPSPTLADQIIPTATPTLSETLTPSPTVLQSPTSTLPTNTPNPNATGPSATDAATTIPTSSPDSVNPTLTAESTPALATATLASGGGYPGPDTTPSATPTATLDPYP